MARPQKPLEEQLIAAEEELKKAEEKVISTKQKIADIKAQIVDRDMRDLYALVVEENKLSLSDVEKLLSTKRKKNETTD